MASCQDLMYATVLGLLFKGIIMTGTSGTGITLQEQGNNVTLVCNEENPSWTKDGHEIGESSKTLLLGSALDDPRGLYTCSRGKSLQVFFRMCQNCVRLDATTVMGLVLGNILATAFLAVAVYKIAAQEPGQLSRASDKQTLLGNEQLYQPLGERSNGEYSRIGVGRARRP